MKNVRSSFISQFPYKNTNFLELETPKVKTKTKQKHSTPSKNQSNQTIPKSLFDKINVSIIIPNPETTKVVENAMLSAGANVTVGKPDNADIIISESQFFQEPEICITPTKKRTPPIATVSAITPRSSKSPNYSGHLILTPSTNNDEKFLRRTKSPRNILLNQIPWVFDTDSNILNSAIKSSKNSKNRNTNSSTKIYSTVNNSSASISGPIFEPKVPATNEDLPQDVLIISDIGRRFRPIFIKIKQKIDLYYGDVPQAYHITPFDPIPPMTKELVEKYKAKLKTNRVSINPQPANNGYCCMCQTQYTNAEMHHCSKSHQRNAKLVDWSEFDQLAIDINSEFLDNAKLGTDQ